MFGNGDANLDRWYAGSNSTNPKHDREENEALNGILRTKKQIAEYYKKSLLHPKEYPGSKIPSVIPIPTATLQNNYTFTVTTNANGMALLVADPLTQYWSLYNDSTFNGQGTGGSATTISNAFDPSGNIIDEMRVVSASITVTYIGSLQNCQGYITGAPASNYSGASDLTYYTAANVEDCEGKRTIFPTEGLKMIYTPMDTGCFDFQVPTAFTTGSYFAKKSMWIIFCSGLPPNSNCLRFDVVRNIEYVSKLTYKDFILHTTAPPAELPSISDLPRAMSKNESTISYDNVVNSLNNIRNNVVDVNDKFIELTKGTFKGDMGFSMTGNAFDKFAVNVGSGILNNLIGGFKI